VTVSYFEWVQDRQGYFWPREDVITRLEHMLVSAFAWCDRDRNLAFAYCTNFQREAQGIGPRVAERVGIEKGLYLSTGLVVVEVDFAIGVTRITQVGGTWTDVCDLLA
jgi:hypothetical protein